MANYYDIRIDRDSLGELATNEDVSRYCKLAEAALEAELDGQVRVGIGDGTESYTFIGDDGYTFTNALTEEMREFLAAVYERFEWVTAA